ncbi:MAG: hypothetical protein UDM08_00015 [Eggerthellaceae bacterium]|jgi:hypothetical protein|nr:hypothetical protein [Eggerthellaceae bacterium]
MSLANQAFNDLARLPSDLDLCEPLHQDERHVQNANTQFCQILEALDIGDATELADALSIDIAICKRVYNNPLLCNGKERALILQELDNSSSPFLDVWDIEYRHGESVGEALAGWTRENFNTPYQFYRQAQELELKCYLIGIVEKLNDRERFGLLYAPNLERAIKEAAAIALEDTPTGEPAIEQINACIASLNHAKEQLLDSYSVLVEARKQ